MPNDNIQRSIKKAAGEGDATSYKEVTYEGYAPCGVAVIVEVVTDNLNRTASEIRHIFDKCGGSLGASGCVGWKFERKGVIVIDNSKKLDEDELMMLALDCGAVDVEMDDDTAIIYTDPADFLGGARQAGGGRACTFLSADRAMVPHHHRGDHRSGVRRQGHEADRLARGLRRCGRRSTTTPTCRTRKRTNKRGGANEEASSRTGLAQDVDKVGRLPGR